MRIAVMGDRQIATTIANRFGGLTQLKSTVQAKKILAIENGLQFRFDGCKRANTVQIEQIANDRYIMRFYKQSFQGCPYVDDRECNFASIVAVFQDFTKLKIQ
jgi:hypothetical protein